MAHITIGLGFLRKPDQEKELRKAAAALPDDWTIEMSGGPGGSLGIFDVVVKKPGGTEIVRKSFVTDNVDDAIRFLQGLKPKGS